MAILFLQPVSSDSHHVPDIVSGHAASTKFNTSSQQLRYASCSSKQFIEPIADREPSSNVSMGPPTRPPRSSKWQCDVKESCDTSIEVGNSK